MKNRITKREEIETKNGIKYHFRDKENTLIASILEDGTIVNTIEDITIKEIEYIKEVARLE